MAKKTSPGPTQSRNSRMITFAEDLGRILGNTQARASAWLGQRQQIAKQLTQVRDTAERLLGELTGGGRTLVARAQGARKQKTAAAPRRRRRLSAEARRRMSEAAKRRWAARKGKGKSKTEN